MKELLRGLLSKYRCALMHAYLESCQGKRVAALSA